MSSVADRLRENLERVRRRIEAACERSGRDPGDVDLIAVTKYAEWPWVEALLTEGVTRLGESRPQQLIERSGRVPSSVEWHLVGHLQRNKVRGILPIAEFIHSVDSFRLLERIDALAGELELRPRVLLQANVSGEASKHGWPAEELCDAAAEVFTRERVRIEGLMTMAPLVDDPEDARPVFRRLRELRDELRSLAPSAVSPSHLSMGMSNDFEVAVEEGATMIRLGSALFDGLADDARSGATGGTTR